MLINTKKNFCYRICHIDNVAGILENGLCTKHHPDASENFISIGNPQIIDTRDSTPVKIPGYGNIGDYIPFYFTPRSMMLLNIVSGYWHPVVPKRSKEEIIVIRCLLDRLVELDRFFFSDGQANVTSVSQHYNDLENLDEIDWDIIHKSDFKKDLDDSDKQRRYQAEFLVHMHVPVSHIESIHVYSEKAAKIVKTELANTDLILPIKVTKEYFFD